MNIRAPSHQSLVLLLYALSAIGVGAALAADPPSPASPSAQQSAPSKATREQMAKLHEQMAACLRSDKTFSECRQEMMKSCQATIGSSGCPMMGMGPGMGRGSGARRGRMMQSPPPAPNP